MHFLTDYNQNANPRFSAETVSEKISFAPERFARIGSTISGVYEGKPYKITVSSFGKRSKEENAEILSALDEAFESL